MYKGIRRIQLLVLSLIVALVLSTWYAQVKIEKNLRNYRAEALHTVLESTHQALLSWYNQQRASAITWANNNRVRSLTEQLLKVPHNRNALVHAKAQRELRALLTPVLTSRKYQGYFLLADNGTSLASSRDANIGTPNLLREQPLFLKEILSGQSVLSQPQASDVPLPNARGELQAGLPTMFIGAPIYNEQDKAIAVFVFRINPLGDFSAILQRGSIGKTGESFAFNRQGRFISSSRFEPELRARGLLKPGAYSMLDVWLRVPPDGWKPDATYHGYPSSWPLSLMARSATNGGSGIDVDGFIGYYGRRVISTWLWDKDLHFGIATEMGKKEAYKNLYIIEYTVYALSAVGGMLLLFISGYFIASQRKLRDSEEKVSSIIEMADEAIISIDRNEHIILVNHAAQQMFGYSAEELMGNSLTMLIPESSHGIHSEYIKNFLNSPDSHVTRDTRGNIKGQRKNGEIFPMEASFSKQRVGGMVILTFLGRDITERLKSEQDLRNSERMFRQVFEATEDAILILKGDRFVDCNDATVSMLHAPDKDAVLSQHPWDLSPERQPDGQLSSDKAAEMIRLAHEKHFHRFEWVHRRMDGEEFPVEVTLTTTQIAGQPYLHTMWNDITERKRAELRLQESQQLLSMLADYSSDMISVQDMHNVFRYVSPACERLLGYRQQDMLGHVAYEFVHPDDVERVREFRIKLDDPNNTVVYRLRHQDGSYSWFETTSNRVLDEHTGEVKEIVSVSRDISLRIESEQKEEQLQRQIMHTQKMEALGRLTGGIAHDFNNILASAKGYTELAMTLAEEQHDEKQIQYLSEVYKSTDRAAAVVKQLLAFARGGKAAPTYQLLQDVIQEALTMMRPLLTSRIQIHTHLDPDVMPVLIDSVQINQVLLNLCINARDAMGGEGEIEIGVIQGKFGDECSSCHQSFEMDAVELYVKDNGPGMEPGHLSRIFDPFYTSKEVGKGSGMGLSVVHGIVHDHGGHITVDSVVGEGTTFHVFLPLVD